MSVSTSAEVDGRRLRRTQNRESVLDALVELFNDGNLTPSSGEIAARAGISPRSLFRYFDDMDDLHRATIERLLLAAQPLLELAAEANWPTSDKVDAIVGARADLFERIGPARRAGRAAAHRRPIVAAQLREGRKFLRKQAQRLFGPELVGRDDMFPAVDALLSFETYDLLRHDQGLSRTAVVTSLTAALNALLGSRR
jgi:TetR/AcrR family transcriptional regulator, regulator of autoinduction and epiphytic fitness